MQKNGWGEADWASALRNLAQGVLQLGACEFEVYLALVGIGNVASFLRHHYSHGIC